MVKEEHDLYMEIWEEDLQHLTESEIIKIDSMLNEY